MAAHLAGAGCKKPERPVTDVAGSLAAIVATCAAVVGDVEVKRAGKEEWTRVTTGAALRVGDTVRTLPGAFARVEFLSGNGIELEEGTTAVVDVAPVAVAGKAVPPAPSERVEVHRGIARGFFAEKAGVPVAPITIRTPGGEQARLVPGAAVPDVRFRLTATVSGTEIAVTSGSASLAGPAGEVALVAGKAVELAREGLGTEVALIDFPQSLQPTVDARVEIAVGRAVPFTWGRVQGATGYRVQIARDLSFREVVISREVGDPTASFELVEEGLYAWRVAARDADGHYGEYGFARRLYAVARAR